MSLSGSESDNESPEVVSSISMKLEREQELREMFSQKRKLRDELKLKRKLKAEKIVQLKKEKLKHKEKREKLESKEDGQNNQKDIQSKIEEPAKAEKDNNAVSNIRTPVHAKIYPKYNVMVESLDNLQNPRASAAVSFREKRLAKIPRESVSNLIAHQEKLAVKNK